MSRKNPFLGLGLNSWSQGFSRIAQIIAGSVFIDNSTGVVVTSAKHLRVENSTDLQLDSSDFTIEAWIYPQTNDNAATIFSKWGPNSSNDQELKVTVETNNSIQAVIKDDIGSIITRTITTSPSAVSNNTWHHIALTRSGPDIRLYVDGIEGASVSTMSGFIPNTTSPFLLGVELVDPNPLYGSDFIGYISNCRVIKGTALYPSAFTPPTQPLQAIFRELNSVAFDGDDGLSTTYDSSFNPGTSDFTIEAFVKYSGTIATDYTVFNIKDGNNHGINVRIGDSGGFVIVKYSYAGQGFSGSGNATGVTLTESVWNHIAFVKSPGGIKIFVNGQQAISTSFVNPGGFNYSGQAPPFYIGVGDGGNSNYFNGSISNVRFVIGNALYTSSFTPPTEPLENITNTVILACNSSSPTAEETGKTITVIGDPSATTDAPFVTSSSLLCCQSPTDATEEATGKELFANNGAVASEFNPFN